MNSKPKKMYIYCVALFYLTDLLIAIGLFGLKNRRRHEICLSYGYFNLFLKENVK